MQVVSKHSVLSKPVLRPFWFETLLFRFSSFLPYNNLTRAAKRFQCILLFLMDCCRRARAERRNVFNIYTCNSLSYGLRKKKAARSAEMFSKLTSFFSSWRRNRPCNPPATRKICVPKMQLRRWRQREKVCVGKMRRWRQPEKCV